MIGEVSFCRQYSCERDHICKWSAVTNSFYSLMQGRGTVVTGRIEQGMIKVGEDVEILGLMQVIDETYVLYIILTCTSGLVVFFPLNQFLSYSLYYRAVQLNLP